MIGRRFWARTLAVLALLFLSVLVHGSSAFSFFGIRPNLPFAFLVAYAFFAGDFVLYLGFVLIGAALIGIAPGFSFPELGLVLVLASLFFLRDRLPVHPAAGSALAGALGTFVWYLIVDPGLIRVDGIAVASEMVYNGVLAALCFFALRLMFRHDETQRASF